MVLVLWSLVHGLLAFECNPHTSKHCTVFQFSPLALQFLDDVKCMSRRTFKVHSDFRSCRLASLSGHFLGRLEEQSGESVLQSSVAGQPSLEATGQLRLGCGSDVGRVAGWCEGVQGWHGWPAQVLLEGNVAVQGALGDLDKKTRVQQL